MRHGTRIRGTRRIRFVGMTLVELMVALAIGSFLMLGAITVFMQGRATFRVNESVARLQENARFALDAIEPDIRMVHYFGLTTRSGKINGRAPQTDPHTLGPSGCADNWAVDLDNAIEGSNGAYPWACAPRGTFEPGTDTLTVRRAGREALDSSALEAGTMYVQSARVQPGRIFVGTSVPAGYDAGTSETHELVVNGYYVDQTSSLTTADNPVPSLRMKTLTTGPAVRDEEVLPGVEDLQFQLGVDTDVEGAAGRGGVDRFVNADDPILDPASGSYLPDAEILAVRVWVRVRAERRETGYENTNTYAYADESFTANDSYRRLVVSKTIYLRNARPAS